MKYTFISLLIVFITACGVQQKLSLSHRLTQGMTKEDVEKIKTGANDSAGTLKDAVKYAQQAVATIEAKMTFVARHECDVTENKLRKEIKFIQDGLDNTEENLIKVNNNLISWRQAATKKEKEVDERLTRLENMFAAGSNLMALSNVTNGNVPELGQGRNRVQA